VSKRMDVPYRSGRSKTWLKSKNPASDAVRRARGGVALTSAHPGVITVPTLVSAYQTTGHLQVAVAQAFVLVPSHVTGPSSEAGTSAHAICGSILTSKRSLLLPLS